MATATANYVVNPAFPFGEKLQHTIRYYGTVTFSAAGDTYATGGLAAKSGSAFKNIGPYADRTPIFVKVWSSALSGLTYGYLSSGLLKILGGGGSGGGTVTSTISLAAGNASTVWPVTVFPANTNNAALTNNNNATPVTGITGVVSTFSGNTTSGMGEIGNGTALNATSPQIFTDTVLFELVVPSN